jgi:peptide/nickel transport system ATP-binding protein
MKLALEIEKLSLRLPSTGRDVLDSVSLTVGATETVALVGESGCGKTLTARSALNLLPRGARARGTVTVAGQDVLGLDAKRLRQLRRGTAAMIFQDPRAGINPLRKVGDFLTEVVRDTDRAVSVLSAVGLDADIRNRYPGTLSGGMLQRVMIAAALMGNPELLLADEPTTALDVTTQAEVVALLAALQREYGTGLLFVTHDLALASAIADRVYVMYAGRVAETGTAAALFTAPRHPYTKALLAATPRAGTRRLEAIEGQPPDLRAPIAGCPFAPRCAKASAVCSERAPLFADGVACHHPESDTPHHPESDTPHPGEAA